MRLAKQGQLLTHHKDKAVLTLLKVNNVIETDFLPVYPEMTLKEMVDVIAKSNRNLFPVINERRELMGVVLLDDIRNIMFRPELYRRMRVSTFMAAPAARIEVTTPGRGISRWLKTANTSASCPRARYSTRTAASSAITARTDPGMFVAQYASQP